VFVFVWVCLRKGKRSRGNGDGDGEFVDRSSGSGYIPNITERGGDDDNPPLFAHRSQGSNPGHTSRHYVIDSATRSKQQQQAREQEGEREGDLLMMTT
jgi:hypothetical protein